MSAETSSFSSVPSYLTALSKTAGRFRERAPASSTSGEELTAIRARSGGQMQRKLKWYDLIFMGIGGMVGAGIFVTTGQAANQYAGPSIIISYIVAGISALLSAFCYTEFAVEMPVAGGAFSYLRITFGEFAAFFTGANLLMEYVLSNAAVARSFTSYFASVFGFEGSNAWRIEIAFLGSNLDFPAVALLIILTIFLCYSTKDSSIFNMVMTVAHVIFILFIIVTGFIKGDVNNLTHSGHVTKDSHDGFFPYGARGVFNAAAIVYFSYIGYDSVSTLAEEVEDPKKNIPIGIAGSVSIVTVFYCLMATTISMLVPYDMINSDAPFSMAFKKAGLSWASKIIGIGTTLGIITSLLVAMLGQARYLCVIGRTHIVPFWFAKVNPSTGTPINATLFLGACTSLIALFIDLDVLINLVSIGTLFVFYMVANALIYRRYVATTKMTNPWPTIVFLLLFTASAIGFVIFWHQKHVWQRQLWWGLIFFSVSCIILTMIFAWKVPAVHKSKDWCTPMMPWFATLSIFLNVFLLGSLEKKAYMRFGVWSAVAVVFYLIYSVHATYDAETNKKTMAVGDIELHSHHHISTTTHVSAAPAAAITPAEV